MREMDNLMKKSHGIFSTTRKYIVRTIYYMFLRVVKYLNNSYNYKYLIVARQPNVARENVA